MAAIDIMALLPRGGHEGDAEHTPTRVDEYSPEHLGCQSITSKVVAQFGFSTGWRWWG
jgi:hypothetical protein